MMITRQLGVQDIHTWKALRLEALQNAPEAFGSSYEEEALYTEDDWHVGLAKSTIFGAFMEGILVGAVGFYTLSHLKLKHRGVLFGLYTSAPYRGQGVANALLKTVITHATLHVSQLHLTCVTTNQEALRLYQKHGFTSYGIEPHALKIGAQYYDEHLMVCYMVNKR